MLFDCSKYHYKGQVKNMAVTQFESVDARRCFPCWDEPAFKVIIRMKMSNNLVFLCSEQHLIALGYIYGTSSVPEYSYP